MPLAGGEGAVAGPLEGLGPGIAAFELLVDVEERPAGEQHRPARHADRSLHRPHAGDAIQHRPPGDEGVDRGRADVRIAQRVDGVGPHVVGE